MPVHVTSGSRLMGYLLTTDMSAADAGTSMWAFGEKAGYEYFVKCYLTPTFPLDDAPGSEKSKARKRSRCNAFEKHTRALEKALNDCGTDNFLVPSVDFFRQGGTYYKVTKKLRSIQRSVNTLDVEEQLLILLSAAYAVKTLHEKINIVHADIKPENFVLQRTNGRITAHLIDFDSGFFQEHRPQIDTMVGDQRYWPPELIEFHMDGTGNRRLTNKIDIFSLGVSFSEYLTGQIPNFPSEYDYIGEALLENAPIEISSFIHEELDPLLDIIKQMMHRNPEMRPSIGAVHNALRTFNQIVFKSEDTFSKLKTSLQQSLESRISLLNIEPLRKVAGSLIKNGSALKIKGLKFDKKRMAAVVKPPYQGRKNN